MEAKKYTQMNNSHNKNISIITRFINVHFTTIFIFISIIFLIFQKEFIFIGGTTWDQIGYIRGAGKQIEKALLTLFDEVILHFNFDYRRKRCFNFTTCIFFPDMNLCIIFLLLYLKIIRIST